MSHPPRIGRYEIERLLGRGGMGTVYLARDPQLFDRRVAIKLIQSDLDSPEARQRFEREAHSIAALNHPNIVAVYDAGEFESRPYLVLEYIEGSTLETVIRHRRLTTVGAGLRWLDDLGDGLQFAHERGIIHRDIKPANLMVDHLDRIRILDFGIARLTGAAVTQASMLVGTVAYMAPECIRGGNVDERVDVFALGAVAYELLTYRRAFTGETQASVMHEVLESAPRPMIESGEGGTYSELETVVFRALEKDPDRRFQSAGAFKEALSGLRARLPLDAMLPVPAGTASDPTLVRSSSRPVVAPADSSGADAEDRARHVPAPTLVDRIRGVQPPPRDDTRVSPWHRWVYVGLAAAVVLTGLFVFQTTQPSNDEPLRAPTRAAGPSRAPGVTRPAQIPVPSPGSSPTPEVATDPVVLPRVSGGGVTPSVGRSPGTATPHPSTSAPSTPGDTPVVVTQLPTAPSEPVDLSATQLFYGRQSGAAARVGLKYRILQLSDERERDVDLTTPFSSGDSVRLLFESNVDGFLYVLQEGSSGRWNVLFPDPRINGGRNQVQSGREYRIPSEDWFTFDSRPGTEKLFVFLTTEPIARLPGFDGPIAKVETLAMASVGELAGAIRQRDLVFERVSTIAAAKGRTGNYVTNRDELGKAVTATIELIHK